jgi:hypothetical protein
MLMAISILAELRQRDQAPAGRDAGRDSALYAGTILERS